MSGRGESHFVRMPLFGARLYDKFLGTEPIQSRLREVALDIAAKTERGPWLDVGTGPGRLLMEIHRLKPHIELYGLDISAGMIAVAQRILQGIPVDLRVGSIRRTEYPSDFFDVVTCVGSFYLWDYPLESLEEVFRILKQGRSAYLFEVCRDINEDDFQRALENNLRQLNWVRRLVGPLALRKAIKMSYRSDDFVRIIEKTSFARSHALERITLSGLPMWVKVTLIKQAVVGEDPALARPHGSAP